MSKPPHGNPPNASRWLDSRLERLVASAVEGAQILKVTPLNSDAAGASMTAKDTGYGAPLRIDVRVDGQLKSMVLHSATPNPFGHQFRADRAQEMLIAADTFGLVPEHTRVYDVGAFRDDDFVSLRGTGEFYLLSEYAKGRLYAEDLRTIALAGACAADDVKRVDELVRYLITIHAIKLPDATLYTRSIRDLLGSGEGIFGIIDGYPEHVEGAPRETLEQIESLALRWRWRLKRHYQRLVRIHGDFHPFNVRLARAGISIYSTQAAAPRGTRPTMLPRWPLITYFSLWKIPLNGAVPSNRCGAASGHSTWLNLAIRG